MDKVTKTIIRYEWASFVRNKFQLLLLAIIFLFGMYAIYYGTSVVEEQQKTIADVQIIEEDEFHQYQVSFDEELNSVDAKRKRDIASDPSYAWFRHGYHAVLPPHKYAALAIGQRDLHPYYHRLTGMSLYYQLFENEIANPVKLYVGNFDLSFVLIYLLPLLIIAFTFGLYSIEKESGVLALLRIQSISIRKIIAIRLLFYFMLITGFALLISLIGLLVSGNMFADENLLAALLWLVGVILYSAFWFGLMFLIISFFKSSAFNAICAAGCWLLFLLVIPAILNVWMTTKFPVDTIHLAELTRRTGLENENDEKERAEVLSEFLKYNPQYKGSDSLFHNNEYAKVYAAFTTLKDSHSKKDVDAYSQLISKRNQWVNQFLWINPAVNMQDAFALISKTDLNTFLNYQFALTTFHKKITSFYFEKLFWDKPITQEDYSKRPIFKMKENDQRWNMVLYSFLKIVIITFLFGIMGFKKMKKVTN
ncbi:DUF3526 domain-containing protein [Flagellimonas pacifica]|uniref:ABC-2 type transport system permease protein n=1 Tax=Flagellimonas pacifica TaxID=1247520 RepID=A0A285ME91_9FLAO|nr:DUF3526 domain-containing protein [Allomuricauda parva]SNY95428.1 ABC-2 type transport system permease protein [Allomuricauda parva]